MPTKENKSSLPIHSNQSRVRSHAAPSKDKVITELMNDLAVDSLLEDYLFSNKRLWPQFEESIGKRLQEDQGLQKEALKVIRMVEKRFNSIARFRSGIPAAVALALQIEAGNQGHNPGSEAPEVRSRSELKTWNWSL